MDEAFKAVLAEYDARREREEGPYAATIGRGVALGRDELLLSVGEEVAKLLHLLVTGCGAKSILEVGTSYGYSTLWLAEAARQTGGRLTTLESEGYKQDHARDAIRRAGLADHVEFITGDALQVIPTLKGPIDFVLLDLWKDLYIPSLELCLPKLSPGALIVADNMLQPVMARADAKVYRDHVRGHARLSSVLLPIGQGIEVSRLKGGDGDGDPA